MTSISLETVRRLVEKRFGPDCVIDSVELGSDPGTLIVGVIFPMTQIMIHLDVPDEGDS